MRSLARFDEMAISGLLTAAGPAAFVALHWVDPALSLVWSLCLCAGLLLAGLSITVRPILARVIASAALVAGVIVTFEALADRPAAALAFWVAVLWLATTLWVIPGIPHERRFSSDDVEGRARWNRVRISLQMTAILAIAISLSRTGNSMPMRLAPAVGMFACAQWAWRARGFRGDVRVTGSFVSFALLYTLLVVSSAFFPLLEPAVLVLSLVLFLWATLWTIIGVTSAEAWWTRMLENPSRQLVATFLVLCLLGTFLLGLPSSSASGEPVPFLTAAFTAVSAVCVTGLVVIDTATGWSLSGQASILLLIQLGGLGIMTFATAFLSAIGRRISLQQEGAIADMVGEQDRVELYSAIRRVVSFTLVTEFVGAVALSGLYRLADATWPQAIWRGVFTSVSAFCNAGFALQSDSLIGHREDVWILQVVALLIILGGLSPAVVFATLQRRGPLRLQVKLALVATVVLLVLGTLLFGAAEWNGTLRDLGNLDKWNNAWFQSVTFRTAGFNSIDFTQIQPATATFAILWMFIGGCPGGTAGGIKTTTFVVLLLSVLSTVRGRKEITAFGRRIGRDTVYRATSVASLGTLWMILLLLAIQFTQGLPALESFFEVASASGTVGLSMGITPQLDGVGRLIVMVAMFSGRVGSLTLLVFLLARRVRPATNFPEGQVDVG